MVENTPDIERFDHEAFIQWCADMVTEVRQLRDLREQATQRVEVYRGKVEDLVGALEHVRGLLGKGIVRDLVDNALRKSKDYR